MCNPAYGFMKNRGINDAFFRFKNKTDFHFSTFCCPIFVCVCKGSLVNDFPLFGRLIATRNSSFNSLCTQEGFAGEKH
jgi:hypothetical protein